MLIPQCYHKNTAEIDFLDYNLKKDEFLSSQRTDHTLKNIPFLSGLSHEELSDLQRIIKERHFPRNKIILMEKDTPNYVYIIYSGKVKAVQTGPDGKEHILAIHNQGDFFGEMAILDNKTSPATVKALEDSDIALLAKADFKKYLLQNEKVLREIISLLCSRLRDAWLMLKVLHITNAEQRVRAVLKLISVQNGVKDRRGAIIQLKLTHEDIAAYASLTRETVTRILGKLLKDEEIAFLKNKHMLLKPAFLKKNIPL
jgi:CRP/FNR family transcriptional regulator